MSALRKIAVVAIVLLVAVAVLFFTVTRGDTADLPIEAVAGTDPTLAEPEPETIPTVAIAEPVGWQATELPDTAPGLEVNRFADGLDHPRVMYALPNGDVLVTLTRAPAEEGNEDNGIFARIRGWIAGYLFSQAGAAGESANKIVLLRDGNGDGVAETQRVILADGLDSPSGMSWHDGTLFVANHDEVLAFDYELGASAVTATPR